MGGYFWFIVGIYFFYLVYRCSRKRLEVKSRYSEILWSVMLVRMLFVIIRIWGGCSFILFG